MENNMTALVSLFARVYHSKNSKVKVFDDFIGEKIISQDEYENISKSMAEGINFFCPEFNGTKEQALKFIVNTTLAPTPLARALFAEKSLETEVLLGTKKYVILGAGYDTFAYRCPKWAEDIKIIEVDKKEVIEDKKRRLKNGGIEIPKNIIYKEVDFSKDDLKDIFDNSERIFCSMLGVSYYLSNEAFEKIIKELSYSMEEGSCIVFDYPNNEEFLQKHLAKEAGEEMFFELTLPNIEKILEKYNFLICEHLNSEDIANDYFKEYNENNLECKIIADKNANLCLCVKKG